MGAEAYIGLSKVLEGHEHLGDISASNHNQLRPIVAKEPLAFIPIYISVHHDVECAEASLEHLDGKQFSLFGFDDIIKLCSHWAVGIVPISKYRDLPKMVEKSRPGSVNQAQMIDGWNKITPGIWVITSYSEYGTDLDNCFRGEYPKLKLGEEVSWEFWT